MVRVCLSGKRSWIRSDSFVHVNIFLTTRVLNEVKERNVKALMIA